MIPTTFHQTLLTLIEKSNELSPEFQQLIEDLVQDLIDSHGDKPSYSNEEIIESITHVIDYLYIYEYDDGDDYEAPYNPIDVIKLSALLSGKPIEPNQETPKNKESQFEKAKSYLFKEALDDIYNHTDVNHEISIDFNLTEEEVLRLIEYVKGLIDREAELWDEEPRYPLIEKVGPTLKVTMP